jgi:hypothetical protein
VTESYDLEAPESRSIRVEAPPPRFRRDDVAFALDRRDNRAAPASVTLSGADDAYATLAVLGGVGHVGVAARAGRRAGVACG